MAIDIIDPTRPGQEHVDSYWAANGGPEDYAAHPVETDMDVDIAIIGGGYTGLSTAYHLGKLGRQSAHVLEANRIGWGCSGRNAGFVNLGVGKVSLSGLIRRWGGEQARSIYNQSRDAIGLVRHLLTTENIDAETTEDGSLDIAHRPNRMKGIEKDHKFLLSEFGIKTRIIDRGELERHYLINREGFGALFYEDGFALNAMRYARGLAKAAQSVGATLHEHSPVSEWSQDRKRHVLSTPGGTVRAREVIIATNGYTGDRLHPALAGSLLPALSSVIVTRPLTSSERDALNWRSHLPMNDLRNLLIYFRLLPDHRLLFGSRGEIEDNEASRAHRRAWLIRRMGEMFPAIKGIEINHFWSGWVCLPFNLSPHVGSLENGTVHYALGYSGTGVAMATYCGKLLAIKLSGAPGPSPSPLLSLPFRPFPLSFLRRFYQRAAYMLFEIQDHL